MKKASFLLVLALLLSGLFGVSPAAAAAQRAGDASVDSRVGPKVCALLGRAYVDGAGCSRTTCADPSDFAKTDPNAETCLVGGKDGHPYGVPIDFRRCDALHRVWVAVDNYCVSNAHRAKRLVPDAPQCLAPYTTYVTLTEAEGYYDLCLQPARVTQLQGLAKQKDLSLAEIAAATSPELCSYRPRAAMVDGFCKAVYGPIPKASQGGMLLVGDSISWRGTNELARRRPDWDIDGIPYRHVDKLPARVGRYGRGHGRPAGLIVALGTNPSPHWDLADYAGALKDVKKGGIVMFVTPYRHHGSQTTGTIQATQRYATYMRKITVANTHVCVADWRKLVYAHQGLLVDGVHPTSYGEKYWATFISQSWQQCVKVVAKQDADAAAGSGSGSGTGTGSGGGSGGGGSGGGSGGGDGGGSGGGSGGGGDGGGGGGLLPLPPLPPIIPCLPGLTCKLG